MAANQPAALAKSLSDAVQCPICLEHYQDPRILPGCGHTLCYECIWSIWQRNGKECPVCRKGFKLDRQSVTNLPRNYPVAQMVETLRALSMSAAAVQPSAPPESPLHASSDPSYYADNSNPAASAYAPEALYTPPTNVVPLRYSVFVPPSQQTAASAPTPQPSATTAYATPYAPSLSEPPSPYSMPAANFAPPPPSSPSVPYNPTSIYPAVTPTAPPPAAAPVPTPAQPRPASTSFSSPSSSSSAPSRAASSFSSSSSSASVSATSSSSATSSASAASSPSQQEAGFWKTFSSWFSFGNDSSPQQGQGGPDQPHYAPWSVSPGKVPQLFCEWAQGRWFAPGNFSEASKLRSVHAVYLPFWVVSVLAQSQYTGSVCHSDAPPGKPAQRAEKWTEVRGSSSQSYSNLVFCSTSDESDEVMKLLGQITDWQPRKAGSVRPYNCQGLLEPARIDRTGDWTHTWVTASSYLIKKEEERCKRKLESDCASDKLRDVHVNVSFTNLQRALVYLPVYILTYEHEGRTFTSLISAQSGTVVGERPYGLGSLGQLGKQLFTSMFSTGRNS